MRNPQSLRGAFIAAAIALPLGVPSPASAAGLFEAIGELFGINQQPERQYRQAPGGYYQDGGGGLGITVRPRRSQPVRERRPVARKAKPAPVPVSIVNLDPAKNPNWYLDDPTLRPGDIVVLKDQVLVFEGAHSARHAREDFTSLEKSRLSKAERERLRAMARISPEAEALAEARQKTAVVPPAE
ncbi:hypothetical protein [Enterovirga sp. CN4-39]|uniref:hypothetical protein n=1 Tax=Enterovirga sp. CN4-39 TaxID=3400910 RepID=UPI003BFEDE2A